MPLPLADLSLQQTHVNSTIWWEDMKWGKKECQHLLLIALKHKCSSLYCVLNKQVALWVHIDNDIRLANVRRHYFGGKQVNLLKYTGVMKWASIRIYQKKKKKESLWSFAFCIVDGTEAGEWHLEDMLLPTLAYPHTSKAPRERTGCLFCP